MEESIIEDSPDVSMHPNWVALATVKFKPKIFVKSSGTEDEIHAATHPTPFRIEIDESSSIVYNEILATPSTVQKDESKIIKTRRKTNKKKKEKIPFNKESLFKLAMSDDADGVHNLMVESIEPDVNAIDAYGWTALMMAACEGAVSSFQKLLVLGADLSFIDRKGNSAVSLAQKKGFQEILQVLEQHQRDCIEISDDDDEPQEHGTQFCSDCGIEIARSTSKSHQTSTVHLFSCKFKGNMDIKTFGIARTNRGFQMMRRTGWDGNSALGPKENGKLYPIKTVMRKKGSGLGIKQDSAKITHFKQNDTSAVHFKPQPQAPTRKEIHENNLKEKRRDQRLRRKLS